MAAQKLTSHDCVDGPAPEWLSSMHDTEQMKEQYLHTSGLRR
jgi:hypothetical protein